MEDLLTFVNGEFLSMLIALALTVSYQIVTGKIHLVGLLTDNDKGEFSVSRLQVLIVGFETIIPFLDAILGQES